VHRSVMDVVDLLPLQIMTEMSPDLLPVPKDDVNYSGSNGEVDTHVENDIGGGLPGMSKNLHGRFVEAEVRIEDEILVVNSAVLEENILANEGEVLCIEDISSKSSREEDIVDGPEGVINDESGKI
jgi:hypothetical protein